MELELQKEQFACFSPGATAVMTREESAETIVPDYNPDISRIVSVSASLFLRARTVADGRLSATGSVKVTLLYLAEDAQGLRSMEYAIPVEQSESLPDGCEQAAVEGRVCGVEARLLNPRKLFTRMDVEWKITPYCRTTLSTCGAIPQQEAYAIETLCEKHEISLIHAVSDKDFVFSDEFTLSGGHEAIRELLCCRVKPRVTDVKSIGSKVLLKGVSCVTLLYAAQDGKLCSYAEELPFSQIIDGVSTEESGDVSAFAVLNLSGSEIHIASEDGEGRTVGVKISMNAFIVLRRSVTVCCITDLYSTSYDLEAQTERIELSQPPVVSTVTASIREQLETGTAVKCVLSADVCFGGAELRREGNQTSLRAAASVSVLYQDESGVPLSLDRRIEITAEADSDEKAQVSVETVCAGDITANINADGVELRFPAEFTLRSISAPSCLCLTSLSAETPEAPDADAPSLVLRALEEGERLWDIAKRCRTTVDEILAANELTDSSALTAGQMLLIPRKR